ncbi:MAG TPA: VWA domain-containing protein [Candidatus Dormibacteraeota bacterium]|nr:VWA domain-containing protein [Candidatus Dormibacteraeota bacterium]
MTHTPLRAAIAFCLTAASLPFAGAPQENPNRPPWAQKTKPATEKSGKPDDEVTASDDPVQGRTTIRVKVNLVNVLVSVLDENNRPSPDLPVEAFQVSEEGNPQKIEIFERETQQPLDLALMIDASLSAQIQMPNERAAAAHFIQQVVRPGDHLAVFGFDENVTRVADFSDKVSALQDAVKRIPPGAGTSIYDAIVLGSKSLAGQKGERRHVIILVTDGGETTSRADFEAARKAAVRSETLLYTILIRSIKNEGGRNTAGEHALQTITETTGGAMFFPDSADDLGIVFDQIDRELRTQYRLAYYPNPRGPADSLRNIQISVLGDYKVRHRKNYYTGRE